MKNFSTLFRLMTILILSFNLFTNLNLVYGQCNPDNPSAPPFCAPAPVCAAGSFLWSQSINPNDGSTSLRMWCGATTSYTIPGPYPANFGSGAVTFNISDVVSYDGYAGRNTVTQNNERWRLVFKKNGTTVGSTGYTNDVPDQRTQGYWRGSLGTVSVPNGVDQIIIEHWSVANDGSCSNSPNSVVPTSVCISATPPVPDVNLTCEDGKKVTLHAAGTNLNCGGSTDINISIPNSAQVYQLVTEVVYKNHDPGNTVTITTTNPSRTVTLNKVNISGGSSNVYVYRGTITGTASNVLYNSVINSCSNNNGLQSMVVYAYRNLNENISQSGVFTNISGYCDLQTYSVPVQTDVAPRTLTIQVPISELTTDNRYLRVRATAGGVTGETIIYGPDPSLNTCCVRIVTVTLNNVPGNTNSVNIEIDTRSSTNPGGGATGCGQSWVAAGITTVTAQCQVCTVTAGSIGANKEICYNTSAGTLTNNVSATGNGTIGYQWQRSTTSCSAGWTDISGATNATYAPGNLTQTTYFRRRARNTFNSTTCDEFSNCVTLTVNPQLNLVIPNDELCAGANYTKTVQATGGTPGYTYSWSGGLGSGSQKSLPAQNGTYTVTVTDSKGCTAVGSFTVTAGSFSATATNDGPLTCLKTTVTMTANPSGMAYSWSGGGTGATKVVTTAGTYTVTVTGANGCTASSSTTVVGNTTVPTVTATNDGPLTCSKTSVTLTATGGGSYVWSGGGTAATKVVTSAGTYTVTVTSANGCTASSSTTVVGNTAIPIITATNDGPLTCSKVSVTLTATGGGAYAWSGGGTAATKVVTTAGIYTVTVTSANGCTATSATTVSQNIVPPSALATNDGPLTCIKTSVTLTANPATGVTYVWSNGGQTTRQKTVTLPGTYSVTITDNLNGCTAVATTTVSQNTVVPNASAENLGGPLTCIDNSVTIQAFPNDATYTYNWNGPSGYSSTSRTNTVGIAGTYTVTVTNTVSNCTSTATTTVTQNVTPPTVTVNNDGPLTCSKTSVTMTALPGTGLTYSWSGGGTGQTKVVTVAGSYTVTVTDIVNGCTAVNSTTVTQNTTVTPATASNDGPLTCSKTSVTLTASPTTGVSYAWSGGGTSQTKVVTVPGLYTLTVTTISNGCTSTATTNVTQDIIAPIASADNVGGPLTCIDNSVTVRAFPDIPTYSYEWSGPNSYYGTSRTQDVSVSGNYVVTVTNTINGCKSSASTAVLQDVSIPTANAGGNKTICNGTSTTLTATGNGSYLWSNNMTTASITVTPVTTTTYTITVTGSNGCTNTASALVTVTPLPASGLSGPTEVCMDEYGVFSASPAVSGATYSWTFDGGTSLDGDANDPTESVKWASSYANTTRTVTLVVTKDNCSSTYTKAVLVKQGAYLNTQALYPVCQGGTVQIGPNPNDPAQVTPGSSFQWTPNLFLNNNTVARPLSTPPFDMQYTLTATVNGCATSMQITVDVNVNLNPVADAGADKVICLSESTTIGGTPTATPPPTGGATISGVLWSVPPSSTITSTLNNPLVSPTLNTQYRVVVVASNGCTDTDFVNITVNPKQKIGNYTWIDSNKDGCQTTGELGLNGVTVSLYTSTGTLVTTATTSNNPTNGLAGYYQFEVCPGSYYVNFGQPTGYVFTGKNICGDVPSNSDANTTNGNVDPFTIVSGQDNFTIDAGFIPVGNIRGNVTADTNNDNVGDSPLANVTINLKDLAGNIVATDVTDASGNYEFLNIPTGEYTIMEVQPTGYNSVSDVDATPDPDGNDGSTPNNMIPVTLTTGENDNDNNLVEEQTGSIRGTVTKDTNNDNVGDSPLANVTINLKDLAGNIVATDVTDASGNYEFLNVSPGQYTIMEVQPTGYNSVSDVDATPDPDGNDGTTPNDMIPVTVTAGEADNDNNLVEEQTANIRGNVTADTNNDNVGDSPLANVTINLKDLAGNIVATDVTDASGNYEFLNVAPGQYTIMEVQPTGYNSVSDVDATPDPDGNDGTTPNDMIPVTVTAGENDNDNNLVEEQTGSIRGTVTKDTNNDNVGDSPLANVTINLKDLAGNIVATDVTDASGNYEFLNVAPGQYTIMEVQPTGYNSVSDIDATPDPDGNDGTTPNDMIPVTVTAGEADNDNNLVEEQTANIRGNVTADTNNDNIGDTPLANVTINLKDLAGNIVATDVTDASGNYEFLNVSPGQYTIMEVQPTGYNSVSDVDATPDPDGNDGTTPNDMIPVTVTAGENDNDNNFVEENLASLGNYVWEDKDADGIQEAGEPGIANVVVRLFNSAGIQVAFKVTDNSGYYLFANLAPGTYTVKFDRPAGYESTSKDLGADNTLDSDADMVTGITVPVVLNGGEDNLTVDAGFYKLAKIGNFVWEDKNANGVQDAFEPGIANVTVTLTGTDALGRVVNLTTATNESGLYGFTGLVPGTYTVTFTKPGATYKPSPSDTPSDDAKDSDANAISGKSGSIVLVSGTDNQTIDAGYYRCGYVGDYVWLDNNLNNLQDAGDVGINGVLVELYKSSNPSTPVQTMRTINDPSNPSQAGYYNFEVCELGNYFIKVKADMTVYNWVQPNQGINDGIDSDIIDFESQTTLIFTVGYASAIEDIDAGLKLIPLPVSLSTFTGRWNERRDVNELNWVTMSEVNNDYFELERSFKGSAFEKVGRISGQGNSNKEVRYAMDDEDISRNGIYTYRLRQVDFDGSESYSSIIEIKVDRKAENGSKIYPNPSVGQVNISVTANEGQKVEANVYDNTSRIVLGSLINTVSEGKDIDSIIERGILAKGIYYVMISIDGEVTSHKLIILE
jgi:protocatechuate 3,4-dioxygenase beta subunit